MRPLPGGDALPSAKPRSRKSSIADPSALNSSPSSHVPTTFFMKSEEEMEHSVAASKTAETTGKQMESTFGVQSLEDTLEAAFGYESHAGRYKDDYTPGNSANEKQPPKQASHISSKAPKKDPDSCKSSPSRIHRRKTSNHSVSNPLTPLNIESRSPAPASALPSSPRSVSLQSLKLSDEEPGLDEVASQAIASSGDEDEETTQDQSGSFPQLVMPSIQMPSRRPFTVKGKSMGKLKVLIAGEAGQLASSYPLVVMMIECILTWQQA